MANVMLIEDDVSLKDIIKFNLIKNGHSSIDTESANEALLLIDEILPDIILLDLMLPGLKGEEFLKIAKSRKELKNVPIIIISAKNNEDKIVEMLKNGADDYITKPFSIRVLLSKIDVILKRTSQQSDIISYGNIEIDKDRHSVMIDKNEIKLTHTEFKLLSFFIEHKNTVFTRSQLLSNIWGYESDVYTRTVDAHISSLRKKINGATIKIKSIPKVGYKVE
jgi:two-component system phosphate regulon response regulator PhoB